MKVIRKGNLCLVSIRANNESIEKRDNHNLLAASLRISLGRWKMFLSLNIYVWNYGNNITQRSLYAGHKFYKMNVKMINIIGSTVTCHKFIFHALSLCDTRFILRAMEEENSTAKHKQIVRKFLRAHPKHATINNHALKSTIP